MVVTKVSRKIKPKHQISPSSSEDGGQNGFPCHDPRERKGSQGRISRRSPRFNLNPSIFRPLLGFLLSTGRLGPRSLTRLRNRRRIPAHHVRRRGERSVVHPVIVERSLDGKRREKLRRREGRRIRVVSISLRGDGGVSHHRVSLVVVRLGSRRLLRRYHSRPCNGSNCLWQNLLLLQLVVVLFVGLDEAPVAGVWSHDCTRIHHFERLSLDNKFSITTGCSQSILKYYRP